MLLVVDVMSKGKLADDGYLGSEDPSFTRLLMCFLVRFTFALTSLLQSYYCDAGFNFVHLILVKYILTMAEL